MWSWLKSWFVSSEQPDQVEDPQERRIPLKRKIPLERKIEAPYSLLSSSIIGFTEVHQIQEIIDTGKQPHETYEELLAISKRDENLRLYLHELMLFSSIRMENTLFFVEVAKILITNHPFLRDYLVSQIFWCFDRRADIFIYTLIEQNVLKEEDLLAFRNAVCNDLKDYFCGDSEYDVYYKYRRFIDFFDGTIAEFQLDNDHDDPIMHQPNYKQNMRKCVNQDPVAVAIRNDNTNKAVAVNLQSYTFKSNIIDRNEYLSAGCNSAKYAAFYGARKCFKISFDKNKQNEPTKIFNNRRSWKPKKELLLCDFAACGGDMDICEMLYKNDSKFSNSLQFAIQYHRNEVFNWLIQKLNLDMTEIDYQTAVEYEFIPAIEMYYSKYKKTNVNLEISKSGNYVLFSKLWVNDKIDLIAPIFMYNSIDCYRFILKQKIDLDKCCCIDSSLNNYPFYHKDRNHFSNPLHISIHCQFIDLIKMLLKYSNININEHRRILSSYGVGTFCASYFKASPTLEEAIRTDNLEIVKLFLNIEDFDPNVVKNFYGYHGGETCKHSSRRTHTIIQSAAEHGNLIILEAILRSPRIEKNILSTYHYEGNYPPLEEDGEEKWLSKIERKEVLDLLAKYGIK